MRTAKASFLNPVTTVGGWQKCIEIHKEKFQSVFGTLIANICDPREIRDLDAAKRETAKKAKLYTAHLAEKLSTVSQVQRVLQQL